jgi:predicted transcriptional regulator
MVRTLRNKIFPQGLFSDPAWDMVLDLTLATIEHRQISISSLCIASNAPTTTALRCIKALVVHGVIEIESDSKDRRRKIVKLTRETLDRMIKISSGIL